MSQQSQQAIIEVDHMKIEAERDMCPVLYSKSRILQVQQVKKNAFFKNKNLIQSRLGRTGINL